MATNFIRCDRDQPFLMPPSLREWVPEDHLVWTVLEAVEQMDLSAFYLDYRQDGHGRPAYEPSMMVALLLYAYARGNRSSRGIERACIEDVAHRIVAGNLVPDHSTVAEFRVRHEAALSELFTGVLSLCRRAGLVSVGVVASRSRCSSSARRLSRSHARRPSGRVAKCSGSSSRLTAPSSDSSGSDRAPRFCSRSSFSFASRSAALRPSAVRRRSGSSSPR